MIGLKNKIIISASVLFMFAGVTLALDDSSKNYFDPINIMDIVLSSKNQKVEVQNSVVTKSIIDFSSAREKFIQGNITASIHDFESIISNLKNDRELLNISKYLYSEGFFSLARASILKIKNKEKYNKHIKNLKTAYEIKFELLEEEENYLLKSASSIKYQNLSQEIAFELKNNKNLMKKSDYANYLMASAFYNLKQYKQAQNFIKTAIKLNEDNINYKLLEAKILLCEQKYGQALNIADSTECKNSILKDDFLNLKYQILAKTAKNQAVEKLNTAKISYLNHDYYKAIADINSSISQDGENIEAYEILFKSLLKIKDIQASNKVIERMERVKKNSPKTYEAKGDIEFVNSRYGLAYEYWKKASKSNSRLAIKKLMLVNDILLKKEENKKLEERLNTLKSAELDENYEIATSILNNSIYLGSAANDIEGAIYSLKIHYLKNAIENNPFKLANWLEFTDISLNKNKNINSMIISTASYLGEFNYYYYWILANLEDANSNLEKALEYYQKSYNLNPMFEPSKKRVEELKL